MLTHKTLVVTTFNRQLYDEYAMAFIESFPEDLDLVVYSEDELPFEYRPLTKQRAFVERNSHRPVTGFKHDAVRFCYKPYAIYSAMSYLELHPEYTRLLWIDADTVFKSSIDEEWITTHLHKENSIMSYLGRPNYHSETGILLFNHKQQNTQQYLNDVIMYYMTDSIYTLKEQHDSFVWDYAREQYIMGEGYGMGKLNYFHNLAEHITDASQGGHIFNRLYSDYMDHRKGKRKATSSKEYNNK